MNKLFVSVLILMALPSMLVFADLNGRDTTNINPAESRKILQRIVDKNMTMFRKYRGVESKLQTTSNKYDAETGKLEETVTVLVMQNAYFYEIPETTVLQYQKNGEIIAPDEYEPSSELPGHPLFDDQSSEHFDITVKGTQMRGGRADSPTQYSHRNEDARAGEQTHPEITCRSGCFERRMTERPPQ